jgi:putative ABC transport system permease protein
MLRKNLFILSLKSLKDRSVRSWITIIGIVVSIAVILILLTLSAGLQSAVFELFEDFGTDRMLVFGADGITTGLTTETLGQDDVRAIEKLQDIDLVIAQLSAPASKVEYKNQEQFFPVIGLPNKNVNRVAEAYKFDRDLIEGRYFSEGERNVVVLGYGIARQPDDAFGKEITVKNSITIEGKRFKVVGVYKQVGNNQDDFSIWMPLEDVREITNKTTEITGIDAIVKEGVDLKVAEQRLDRLLEKRLGEDNYIILTPEALLRQFNSIIGIVQGVLLAIALISLLVGALGIANTMFTAVLEREKDIGIMKAIGAANSSIMILFLIESGLIGIVGGTAGVIFGIIVSFGIGAIAAASGFELLSISINITHVLGCLAFAFIIGMLSGLLPSYLASRKKIVDTLRDA